MGHQKSRLKAISFVEKQRESLFRSSLYIYHREGRYFNWKLMTNQLLAVKKEASEFCVVTFCSIQKDGLLEMVQKTF